MSDEMNTNNGEETAALFVSSQKRKQAEEEARKKAEAEQAKRDAAEAEVLRMEAEVEERKRKAEEEKRALEEAAKQAEAEKANVAEKLKSSVNVEEIKSKVKEKTEGKSKLPIFIGAGVAAVVIIAFVIVLVLKGRKPAIDFETLEFAKEYSVNDDSIGMTVLYPESMYTGFAESKDEDGLIILESESENSKQPTMKVCVSPSLYEEQEAPIISAKHCQSLLDEVFGAVNANIKITEEKVSDTAADQPGKYFHDCTATTDNGEVCAVSSWLEPDSNGHVVCVMGVFSEKGTDPANVIKLRDKFEEKNSDNALKIPGGNPPASSETDGMLEIDAMHMGVIVPKDLFKKVNPDDQEMLWWADSNGAIYSVALTEVDFDFELASENVDRVQEILTQLAETMAGLKGINDLESRMKLSDKWSNDLIYDAEYKDVIGGVKYWEGNHASMWRDVRTNKYYVYDLVLLAPSANEDYYKQLFYKGTDRLQDI